MKSICASIVLLLASVAIAQDTPPDPLAGLDRTARFCRLNGNGVPGCIAPPHATYSPEPVYPEKARKKKEKGTVVVALFVGIDGLAHEVKIDRGLNSDLDGAAVDTVKRWKFDPASKDGKPVAAEIKVEISFNLY
ncbi:MAG TPA: energy transducer TonB [Terriglobales bacterium]|nr:energy transducer TonB [Terriglobales bacterium]